jgi:enolase-phosphatase E1
MIQALLLDIEGTLGSIEFVHETLFPYAKAELGNFLRAHASDARVAPWIKQIAQETGLEAHALDAIEQRLQHWIAEDRKHTALKALQGIIWQSGYERGDFQAHVYPDVPVAMSQWRKRGLRMVIYSSGSIQAQQLFFKFSCAGDLQPYLSGYFDTTVGPKREAGSYRRIAAELELSPEHILFLSDIAPELDAAQAEGLLVTQIARPDNAKYQAGSQPQAASFFDVRV